MTENKGLNAFQLKLGMMLLMVLDHIHIIPHLLTENMMGVFHVLTRCVAVWFAYVAVEGFIHTRSRLRYMGRLFIWAGLMFLGNSLLNNFLQVKGIIISNNIFLTLASGLLMLGFYFGFSKEKKEISKQQKILRIVLGTLILLLASPLTEGGLVILPFMLLTYSYRNSPKLRTIFYLALAVLLFAVNFQMYPTWAETLSMLMYNSDWLFITVLPFISLYNGQRGANSKVSKYLFYIFYPAHIWLLALLAFMLK